MSNWVAVEDVKKMLDRLPKRTIKDYYGCKTNWQKEYESLVRTIGSYTYGKERWFLQDDGTWYDRYDGHNISIDELHNRIGKELRWLDEN